MKLEASVVEEHHAPIVAIVLEDRSSSRTLAWIDAWCSSTTLASI